MKFASVQVFSLLSLGVTQAFANGGFLSFLFELDSKWDKVFSLLAFIAAILLAVFHYKLLKLKFQRELLLKEGSQNFSEFAHVAFHYKNLVNRLEPEVEIAEFKDKKPWKENCLQLFKLGYTPIRWDSRMWIGGFGAWKVQDISNDRVIIVKPVFPHGLSSLESDLLKIRSSEKDTQIYVIFYDDQYLSFELDKNTKLMTRRSLIENIKKTTMAEYQLNIRNELNVKTMPFSSRPISKVFTDPDFKKSKSPKVIKNLTKYMESWISDSEKRGLIILGEYGSGKSTALMTLVSNVLENQESSKIPILYNLRGTDISGWQPSKILNDAELQCDIDKRVSKFLYEAGELVIIFDGFDEMKISIDKPSRRDQFSALWRLTNYGNKIIIAGRENFFESRQEFNSYLRTNNELSSDISDIAYVEPFSIKSVESALENFKSRQDILTHIENDSTFRTLCSKPTFLIALAEMWEQDPDLMSKLVDEGSLSSARVVGLTIKHAFDRQAMKEVENGILKEKIASGKHMILTKSERMYFTRGIACQMMFSTKNSNSLSRAQAKQCVTKLLNEFPDPNFFPLEKFEEKLYSGKLKSRLENIETKREMVELITRDLLMFGVMNSESLSNNENESTVSFAHKSMLEYLAGSTAAINLLDHNQKNVAKAKFIVKSLGIKSISSLIQTVDAEKMFYLKASDILQDDEGFSSLPADRNKLKSLWQKIFFKKSESVGKAVALTSLRVISFMRIRWPVLYGVLCWPFFVLKYLLIEFGYMNGNIIGKASAVVVSSGMVILFPIAFGAAFLESNSSSLAVNIREFMALESHDSFFSIVATPWLLYLFIGLVVILIKNTKDYFLNENLKYFFKILRDQGVTDEELKKSCGKQLLEDFSVPMIKTD